LIFGALGDIHGDFESVRRVMAAHPDVPFWVCVGDVADADGRYEPLPGPLYWIKGNNENFDALAAGVLPANLHFVPNAETVELDGVRAVGLGGTFAPTWYDSPAAELPYPGQTRAAASGRRAVRDDKRRHFVREEVEACKRLRGIDLFLSHEAPRPYWAGAGGRRNDAGKTPINEVLAAMQPRLHLFGHHHRFTDDTRQGVRSIGLDLVARSYLLIRRDTLAFERRATGES
jgi:Icc-related predicted phosphoesterase